MDSEHTDIIYLQETLTNADLIIPFLQNLKSGWTFHAHDAIGRSGGIALGINIHTIKITSTWGGAGFIGMDIFSFDLGIIILNIYSPCLNRVDLWTHLLNLSIVNSHNLNLGGDLNFSIRYGESWGSHAQINPLSDGMSHLMEQHQLIYIPMHKMMPTWRNRRTGDVFLAR